MRSRSRKAELARLLSGLGLENAPAELQEENGIALQGAAASAAMRRNR
jgi:hypothetical protein